MPATATEVWIEIDLNVTRSMPPSLEADLARERLADGLPVELIFRGERCKVLSIEPQFDDGEMFFEVTLDLKTSFAIEHSSPGWLSRAQYLAQRLAAGEEAFIVFDDDQRFPILAMWSKTPA